MGWGCCAHPPPQPRDGGWPKNTKYANEKTNTSDTQDIPFRANVKKTLLMLISH